MRSFILVLFVLLLSFGGYAQTKQITITGEVYDETGAPLAGAAVVSAKISSAVSTDDRGSFSIKTVVGDEIIITFLGYKKVSFIVKNASHQIIDMKLDEAIRLDQATVVGYGKQERRDITGSVSSIKLLEHKPFMSVDQLLQGQATGVFVSGSTGALGAANLLTIRGVSSIMGDNNPLYVVDGVPIYGTDRSANTLSTHGGAIPAASLGGVMAGGGQSLMYDHNLNYSYEQNPLMFLNPEDIESIEILKDAFATSIYGSRGAAGVILITTKSGSMDKLKVNVTYTFGTENPLGKYNLLNGEEYNRIYTMYYPKANFSAPYNTDWQDVVTRTANSHSINANISGGTQKTSYYISLAGSTNESYIVNNDLTRFSLRTNLNTNLSKKWTLGTSTSISKVDNNSLNANSIYGYALLAPPNLPVYNEDGSYYYGFSPNTYGNPESYNPLATAMEFKMRSSNMSVVTNTFLEFKPTDWLSLRSEIGANVSYTRSTTRKPKLPEYVSGVVSDVASESTTMNNRIVNNNIIEVNKEFNENHFFQAVVGHSYEYATEFSSAMYGSGFFSDYLEGVGTAGSSRVSTGSGEEEWALLSFFTRINYQAMKRYMTGISYRLDGSSRYNKAHRFIQIPSFSLGWRLSEENFIKDNIKWIYDWKLRASIGWSSKDPNNTYYGAQATYGLAAVEYGKNKYLNMTQPGNEDLRWEKTVTYDIGTDISLFDEKLKFTIDYYYKRTTDMLFASDLPLYTGYTKQNQNIADMENQGIEFQVYSYNIVKPNFSWMTILNLSSNTNKILKLSFEGNQLDQANSTFKYYAVGYPIAQWYLHEWEGVDPHTGDPLWRLADGTLTTTPPGSNYSTSQNNKKICGSSLPLLYGSLSNSFVIYDFELSAMLNFSYGGRTINSTRAMLLTYATNNGYNLSKEILNYWQIDGQITDIPKLQNKSILSNSDYTVAVTSTRFIEDNSFLRLKSLQLTYNVPKRFLRKLNINTTVRLYSNLTNLFTITKYSGLDPEVSAYGSSAVSSGYDNLTMPQTRAYQFGIKIGL